MGAVHTSRTKPEMDSSSYNSRRQPNDTAQSRSVNNNNSNTTTSSSNARPLSIEAVSSTNNDYGTAQPISHQPRQPGSLQGLLRFAAEASDSQDPATSNRRLQPLDEERKEFLQKTLKSLTGNVIEELQQAIQILSNVADLRCEDDVSSHEAALERIMDYIDNIDVANDFYKIGGFSVFRSCLNSPHGSIRWRTAEVIAELAQNNPFCQERFLDTGLFPVLLGMVDTDPLETVRIKALYAVSCIVRECPLSLQYMDQNDGYSILLRAMQSSIRKLQIKSAFLLSSLCNKENMDALKFILVKMGLVEQVVGLLTIGDPQPELRDQLLNILSGLTHEDFLPALKECRRADLGLRSMLERCIKDLKDEESWDQIDACHRLLDRAFADQDTNQETNQER